VELIVALAEVDARWPYLGEGCSSLFVYCTRVLHLSEHAAYGRIEAARAARKFPLILELLVEGALTLTAVTLLTPHLTPENAAQILDRALALLVEHRISGPLFRARLPGVSSRRPARGWRRDGCREHPAALPRAQRVRGGAIFYV
jgi:hypothetical protein